RNSASVDDGHTGIISTTVHLVQSSLDRIGRTSRCRLRKNRTGRINYAASFNCELGSTGSIRSRNVARETNLVYGIVAHFDTTGPGLRASVCAKTESYSIKDGRLACCQRKSRGIG